MIKIRKVISEEDISETAHLAHDIWTDHFIPIIGSAQVEYMLDKFQSPDAMTRQISGEYEYFLAMVDDKNVGYMAVIPDVDQSSLMISKIYVKKDVRGNGVGCRFLQHAEAICIERGFNKIWLTVNKFNRNSIAWYERMGFANVEALVQDIGKGYVMDDFKMEKLIV